VIRSLILKEKLKEVLVTTLFLDYFADSKFYRYTGFLEKKYPKNSIKSDTFFPETLYWDVSKN